MTAKRELRSRVRYSRPGCSKQGYDNQGLVPNRIRYESLKTKFSLNSFCLQFDDLKIKEKIIQEITFKQEREKFKITDK